MNNVTLSQETAEMLIGKKIIDVGHRYIVLDNGCRIYLDDSEIEMLNS